MCDNSVVTKAVPEIWDYSVTVKTNTDGSRGMSAAVIVDSDSKKKKTYSLHFKSAITCIHLEKL